MERVSFLALHDHEWWIHNIHLKKCGTCHEVPCACPR
jgi:hypothetical protein